VRRLTRIIIGGTGLAITLCAAGFLALPHANLAPLATSKLAQITGRNTHIAALHITPGPWLTLDADDLTLANIPNGRRPNMITLGHLHAQIRLLSLLHGPITTRDLIITNVSALFERTPDHTPNWRFKTAKQTHPDQPGPDDTSWFPNLHDATIKNSNVTYCSSNGRCYNIGLDHVLITTQHTETPVEMTVAGSYNTIPVSLAIRGGPIALLRHAGTPYPTHLHATSGDLTLDLNGTITDPLNFDGVDGQLSLVTPTASPLMALAGEAGKMPPLSVTLEGHAIHTGNLWNITHGKGHLGKNSIDTATLNFTEGQSKTPDRLEGNVAFKRLDLNSLLPPSKDNPEPENHTDITLSAPASPDPLLNLQLSADSVRYNTLEFIKTSITVEQESGRIEIPAFQLGWLGASLHASGTINTPPDTTSDTSDIHASIDVTGADIDRFRLQAGLAPIPVSGSLSFRVKASASTIKTLGEASQNADIAAVVGMNTGRISQKVIEIASANMGLLFHRSTGTTPVTCLLGALTMRHGDGTVVPLRIYTPKGSIVGEAMFNLNRRWFELAFQTRTPSIFALDIPIRVSGPFNNPSIGLAGWSARGRELLKAARKANTLPAGLENFSPGKACL